MAAAHRTALEQARTEATYAWDASPISTARLSTELWAQIKKEDWSLVAGASKQLDGASLDRDKHYQSLGGSGGAGVGYGAPAAVGAALANKKYGRFR